MGALLAAMAFSSDRAVLAPCCGFRAIRLRQVADDHAIGNVAASVGLLALVPERHLDGKPGFPAAIGLWDLRADDRCLLGSDRLSPVAEDRPHFYVQTLRAASAGAPASWPSWPGRVSVSRMTRSHRARALHARQASSRLPRTTQDGRSQISDDLQVQRQAQGRPPPPSCPMCLSGLAYHRRDNLPGQIRA